jgi:hypothetical protein
MMMHQTTMEPHQTSTLLAGSTKIMTECPGMARMVARRAEQVGHMGTAVWWRTPSCSISPASNDGTGDSNSRRQGGGVC